MASPSAVPAPALRGLIGALIVYWLLLLNQLRYEWSINELYGYGWFVPFLALYLGWLNWEGRPAPDPPGGRSRRLLLVVMLLLALAYLPARLLQEANPDWRLVSWLMAGLVVGMTWAALALTGGAPWWRRFGFASAFILIAVPWPTFIELPLTQGLMRAVAACTVELLNWTVIPARALGNVIELPTGLVGVDEACSGVRSLQAVLMAGLFVGEFYVLSVPRRLLVLAAGVAAAFVLNVARSFTLVWIISHAGHESFELWHGPAGYTVLFLAVTVVWALAHGLSRAGLDSRPPAPSPGPGLGGLRPAPLGFALGLVLWLLLAEGVTEGWYRWHEAGLTESPGWTVHWPQPSEPVALGERERVLLRTDDISTADWFGPDGVRWRGYFLRWPPGRNAAQLARLHRPDVCLPAAGAIPRADFGTRLYPVDGLDIPFRQQEYASGRVSMQVFYALWEDRAAGEQPQGEDFSAASRLRAVAEGRRHTGQQVLEVVAFTAEPPEVVRGKFQQVLQQIVVPAQR